MNRVAILTPLPPARTGVAHYASMLVPALTRATAAGSVRAFASLDGYDADDFDAVIYQLGNNPHHEWIYTEAMRVPGVVVLHDLVLHHLIVEMTLARGDAEGYVAALEASHGQSGAAWARGRAAGLHSEMGNFLLPASVEVARHARAVIVHNHYAADRLRSFGVETPIHVVPHPYIPETRQFDRGALRARHGFDASHRVIGFFGFLTSAKRAEVVLEAFRIAREREPRLALLVVGEPAPNIDLETLRGDGVVLTGYVADDQFPAYYAAADRFVNLRYPSAGETSGTLIRALDAGKPVAVSDYAQFAELPDDVAFKVPLGEEEVARLVEFFTRDFVDVAPRQRRWLDEYAALERTVAGYRDALEACRLEAGGPAGWKPALRGEAPSGRGASGDLPAGQVSRIGRGSFAPAHHPLRMTASCSAAIPIFPRLELVDVRFERDVILTLRNAGDVIRTRTYGQPEYRLIARLFDGEVVVQDQWLALPRDLGRGETTELVFPRFAKEATTLRLYHALQDVPPVDGHAWESTRVR